METRKLWQAVGRLRKPDEPASKAMARTVLFTAQTHEDAFRDVEGALLHNWSPHEHKVEVLSLTMVRDNDGDQSTVIVT